MTMESLLMKVNGIKTNFMEEEKFIMIAQNNYELSLTIETFKTLNNIGNFIKVKTKFILG
jgi:hypothetical protein